MSALQALVLTDLRLNTTAFAAQLYPDRTRHSAGVHIHNTLKAKSDNPDRLTTLAALTIQVQALATTLLAILPFATTKQLLRLGSDKRLRQKHFTRTVFHDVASGTGTRYWIEARDRNRELTEAEQITLRNELQKLADDCTRAIK